MFTRFTYFWDPIIMFSHELTTKFPDRGYGKLLRTVGQGGES